MRLKMYLNKELDSYRDRFEANKLKRIFQNMEEDKTEIEYVIKLIAEADNSFRESNKLCYDF